MRYPELLTKTKLLKSIRNTNANTFSVHINERNDHMLLLILVCNLKSKHKSNTFLQLHQFQLPFSVHLTQ